MGNDPSRGGERGEPDRVLGIDHSKHELEFTEGTSVSDSVFREGSRDDLLPQKSDEMIASETCSLPLTDEMFRSALNAPGGLVELVPDDDRVPRSDCLGDQRREQSALADTGLDLSDIHEGSDDGDGEEIDRELDDGESNSVQSSTGAFVGDEGELFPSGLSGHNEPFPGTEVDQACADSGYVLDTHTQTSTDHETVRGGVESSVEVVLSMQVDGDRTHQVDLGDEVGLMVSRSQRVDGDGESCPGDEILLSNTDIRLQVDATKVCILHDDTGLVPVSQVLVSANCSNEQAQLQPEEVSGSSQLMNDLMAELLSRRSREDEEKSVGTERKHSCAPSGTRNEVAEVDGATCPQLVSGEVEQSGSAGRSEDAETRALVCAGEHDLKEPRVVDTCIQPAPCPVVSPTPTQGHSLSSEDTPIAVVDTVLREAGERHELVSSLGEPMTLVDHGSAMRSIQRHRSSMLDELVTNHASLQSADGARGVLCEVSASIVGGISGDGESKRTDVIIMARPSMTDAVANEVGPRKASLELGGGTMDEDVVTTASTPTPDPSASVALIVPRKSASEEVSSQMSDLSTEDDFKPKRMFDIIRKDLWSADEVVVHGALQYITVQVFYDVAKRASIARSGGLLAIVHAMENHSLSPRVQIAACQALEKLALDNGNEVAIREVGGVDAVVSALVNHLANGAVQEAAWSALQNLSCENSLEEMPFDSGGGFEKLVAAMRLHRDDAAIQTNACGAIANICVDNERRLASLVDAGGIVAMAAALHEHWGDKRARSDISGALCTLLQNQHQQHVDSVLESDIHRSSEDRTNAS